MKKKKQIEITCIFCRHYGESKAIHNDNEGIKKACKTKGKEVRYHTEVCELFELNKWFYCLKNESMISVDICNRRYIKGYRCNKCWQGIIIDKIIKEKEKENENSN
jgi:hypothetical protein